MKQWQLGVEPGIENLQQVETETPQPQRGEVLVRLHAASLNYRDLIIAKGQAGRHVAGRVPLSDGAGEVVAVGEGVNQWQIGDRVAGTFFRDWQAGRFDMKYHDAALGGSVDGVLSEHAVFPEHALVRLPSHFSFEAGATLPCAGVTAWAGLVTRGGIVPGDAVLLQGTGGVSIFGLQIALAAGARTIITSSSDEKLQRARELGAHETINYQTTPEWDKEVWRLTGKRGVDHVLEVGGPGTLGRSLNAVAAGGQIAQIGVLTGFAASDASLFPITGRNARIEGIYVGSRECFQSFVRFLEAKHVEPVIDRVFDWEETIEAYQYMESGRHFGKVVIRIGQ
jgi:NADPH:quinone reductase-like Zn-dependent oxidoreductase